MLLKRKAHKLEIDGNILYVRSLTKGELRAVDAIANDDEKETALLRVGVCNEDGLPYLGDDFRNTDWPINVAAELVTAIYERCSPGFLKKVLPLVADSMQANNSCGDSQGIGAVDTALGN